MKKRIAIAVISLAALALGSAVKAQTGSPFIHDPSTVVECDGKYDACGTGGG